MKRKVFSSCKKFSFYKFVEKISTKLSGKFSNGNENSVKILLEFFWNLENIAAIFLKQNPVEKSFLQNFFKVFSRKKNSILIYFLRRILKTFFSPKNHVQVLEEILRK